MSVSTSPVSLTASHKASILRVNKVESDLFNSVVNAGYEIDWLPRDLKARGISFLTVIKSGAFIASQASLYRYRALYIAHVAGTFDMPDGEQYGVPMRGAYGLANYICKSYVAQDDKVKEVRAAFASGEFDGPDGWAEQSKIEAWLKARSKKADDKAEPEGEGESEGEGEGKGADENSVKARLIRAVKACKDDKLLAEMLELIEG